MDLCSILLRIALSYPNSSCTTVGCSSIVVGFLWMVTLMMILWWFLGERAVIRLAQFMICARSEVSVCFMRCSYRIVLPSRQSCLFADYKNDLSRLLLWFFSGVLGLVQEKLKKRQMKFESGGNSWTSWYKYSSLERRTRLGSRSHQVNDICVDTLSPVFQSQCSYSRVCIFEIWDH
jgi:hypothetical protein